MIQTVGHHGSVKQASKGQDMALLIATGISGWMSDDDIRDALFSELPGADIRTPQTMGDASEIEMLAVSALRGDLAGQLPNLKLVQKLGAGVETIVAHPALPAHVRVARLKPDAPAREIAEYFLAYILRHQRNMDHHIQRQAAAQWDPVAPRITPETVVGVLGLGHIGSRTALMLRDVGFQVVGWSRSPKTIDGVTCHHGADSLPGVLSACDFVAAILPSTPLTRDLMNAEMLAHMKPGAVLLNAGRGDLVVEDDLRAALDKGLLSHAVLDVVRKEPLPEADPLWRHPAITITPHVSGWHLGDALKDVAENYRRLRAGEALLHEVDRARGY